MGLNIAIGFEVFYPQLNGVMTAIFNLMDNYKKMGHNCIIITPLVVKDGPTEVHGAPVYYIPSRSMRLYPGVQILNVRHKLFKQILQKHKIDIIQTTCPWYTAVGMGIAAKKLKIANVMTFHTNLHNEGYMQYIAPFINKFRFSINPVRNFVWYLYKVGLRPVDLVIAPSPAIKRDIHERYPKKRIEYVLNGIDIDMFAQGTDEALCTQLIPQLINKPYALFIGRQAQEKKITILLKAVSEVVKTLKDFHLLLVGDGPKEDDYKALAKTMGISQYVTFLGRVDHDKLLKSGIINHAKYFVSASTTEINSMTVIESLCCQIPLVVINDESMTHFTEGTACYFTPDDHIDMSKSMIKLWQDKKYYAQLKQATKDMLYKFDGKKVAERYIELYYETIGAKKNPKKH